MATVQDLQDKIKGLMANEIRDQIKNLSDPECKQYLQEKAQLWKSILLENVQAQSRVYEDEDEIVEMVRERQQRAQAQIKNVSFISIIDTLLDRCQTGSVPGQDRQIGARYRRN